MPENIQVTLSVSVGGGPKLSAPQSINVEGYDKLKVTVESETNSEGEITTGTKTVEVQPGAEGQVQFLFINSDQFSTNEDEKKLTYTINDEKPATAIELDAPLLLIGDGAMALFGEPPRRLSFSNSLGKSANIEILVGRNVSA